MVRIADLVRGNTPPPASKSDDRGDGIRLSNLSELVQWNKEASPTEAGTDNPPDAAGMAPDGQTEVDLEKPPEVPPEKSSEREMAPICDFPSSPDCKTLYFNAQAYLKEVKDRLLGGRQITLEQPLAMIGQMIAQPPAVDEMYQLTLAFGHGTDMYIASPVNSMIYSFKIGLRMGYSPEKLTEICLAALHHDIGMYLVPDAVIRQEGKLTEPEFALMRKHTETGRDLFVALRYPNVGRAIHEHHERENGQGYPDGLKGNEISEYAKIIGICDSYEAMTHDRPHKKAAAQYLSVLQLAGSKNMLFALPIVKMFLEVITLYPTGSYVRLNNKSIGIVVETNTNNPLKPVVRIVVDGHGKKVMEERMINLAENTILTITAGISTDEIPPDFRHR